MTCRDMRMSRQIKKMEDTYKTDKIKMAIRQRILLYPSKFPASADVPCNPDLYDGRL